MAAIKYFVLLSSIYIPFFHIHTIKIRENYNQNNVKDIYIHICYLALSWKQIEAVEQNTKTKNIDKYVKKIFIRGGATKLTDLQINKSVQKGNPAPHATTKAPLTEHKWWMAMEIWWRTILLS